MYIKNHMTVNPITVSKEAKITQVLDIMANGDFHRLPVVDNDGNLIGLVTEGVIQKNSPSSATSLSIHELNYLLSKTIVQDIMIKHIITISPDALLEEAAVLMRKNDIGCLPVVLNQKLIGIITQNDIFDAFVNLQGYNIKGTRIVLNIDEDKPGVLHKISKVFFDQGISISHLAVYHEKDGIYVIVKVRSQDDKLIESILKEHQYSIETISVQN